MKMTITLSLLCYFTLLAHTSRLPIEKNLKSQGLFGQDSTPCKLVGINAQNFREILDKKFRSNTEIYDYLASDSAANNVTYLHYSRPSGFFLLVKVFIDSKGNYLSHALKRNYELRLSNKKYKKFVKSLKTMNYAQIIREAGFLTSNCYVSDGADLIVVVKSAGQITYGAAVFDIVEKYGFKNDIQNFINNNKRLTQAK